ncbi:MAG: DUF2238 domain-containing protein [Candidatus Paceibacterota bacterium]
MAFTLSEKIIGIVSALYVVFYSFVFFQSLNYEFIAYIGVLLFFFFLITLTIRKTNFSPSILSGLSFWGFLHLSGGGIHIDGATLYSQELIHFFGKGESFILKYDQAVHFWGFFITTFVIYHLFKNAFGENAKRPLVYITAGLASMGLGVVNELVEFGAFLAIEKTGVGGFFNLSLDLVFNTLGVVIAVALLFFLQGNRYKERG